MTELRERAIAVLRQNDRGGYTVPTDGLYPFQWNWDAGFVAMGWATFDEPRAWRELERLLEGQWADGMVPHIIFHRDDPRYFPGPEVWGTTHRPPTSGIPQPPILAVATRWIWQHARDRDLADRAVRQLYPRLLASHRWFHAARDPDACGLVSSLHPWETGMDNSPAWDEALKRVPIDQLPPYQRRDLTHVDSDQRPHSDEYDRYLTLVQRFRACGYDSARMVAESPFRVVDLCTNAILLRADRDLLGLAEALDLPAGREQLVGWIERGRAGLDQLWSAQHGGYRAIDQRHDETIAVGISAGFLPLFAGGLDPERAQQLINTLEAWLGEVRRGVPSTDPGAAMYEPRRYWRGPIWLIVNWMIAEGLTSYDAHDLAERLRQGSLDLVSNAGFFEYFNPASGEGLGGGNFSWTAAVTLFWLLASQR